MAHQAIITLTSRTPGIVPAKRILRLNSDRPTIPIGRASKSISKGLLSAEDNAWFDNPVMSRDHAELVFSQDTMSVMIKDIRSMHGTQLNDVKLSLDAPQAIKNGDIVSFGAEVRRGPETFPPCRFHVEYEFLPWARGFQFPDSDVEDNQSEEDDDICKDSQEDEMTPIESPVPKKSISVDAIDLTKDDSEPKEILSNLQAPSVGKAPSKTQTTSALVEEEITTRASGHLENPILLEDLDSDESDEDSESSIIQEEYEESEEHSDEDSDKENTNEDDDDEDSDAAEQPAYDWGESQENPKVFVSSEGAAQHMFYDNKDIPMSSIRTTAALPESQVEVGTASRSMLDVGWEAALSGDIGENTSPLQDDTIESRAHNNAMINEASGNPIAPNSATAFPLQASVAPIASTLQWGNTSSNRLPSPSDAAMPKSMKIPIVALDDTVPNTGTINPVQMQQIPEQNWKAASLMSQTLGEKTGKYDFFQAREINRARMADEEGHYTEHGSISDGISRAKFNQLGHPYNPRPVASSSNQFGTYRFQQHVAQQQRMAQENQRAQQTQQLAQHRMASLAAMQQRQQRQQVEAMRIRATYSNPQVQAQTQTFVPPDSCESKSHCGFNYSYGNQNTNYVVEFPKPDYPVSSELDMTSAVTFNQSKATVAAPTPVLQDNRSAVRIDDIIRPSSTASSTTGIKRKADEISDVLEEEVRVWASRDASIPSTTAENTIATAVMPAGQTCSQDQLDETQAASSLPTSETISNSRASKKLKRFAEAVGYAALGGFAVGAGLFSVLVATAPDFN